MGRGAPGGPSGDGLGALLPGWQTHLAVVSTPVASAHGLLPWGLAGGRRCPGPPQTHSGSGGPEPALRPVLLAFLVPWKGWAGLCGAGHRGEACPSGRGAGGGMPSLRAHSPGIRALPFPQGAASLPQGPAPTQAGTHTGHTREHTREHPHAHTRVQVTVACAHPHTYLFTGSTRSASSWSTAAGHSWRVQTRGPLLGGGGGVLGEFTLSVVSWAAGCRCPLPAMGASYAFHQPEPGPGPGRDPLPGLSSRPWVTLNEARCFPWFLCVDFLAPTSMGVPAREAYSAPTRACCTHGPDLLGVTATAPFCC